MALTFTSSDYLNTDPSKELWYSFIKTTNDEFIEFEFNKNVFYCDVEFEYLLAHKWNFLKNKTLTTRLDGKYCTFHRLVLGVDDQYQRVNFIDGDKFNLRKINLKIKNVLENITPIPIPNVAKLNIISTTEWEGGKTAGCTIELPSSYSSRIRIGNNKRISKNFLFSKYSSKEEAWKAAEEYRLNESLTRNLIKNRYRYITNDNNEIYLEVQATQDKTFICDIQDLQFVKDYTWYLHDTGKYVCIKTTLPNGKKVRFHNMITGWTKVDHICGNGGLDNRRQNLRNGEMINSNNKKLQSNNNSGVTGVSYDKNSNSWIVNIKIKSQNMEKTKTFSCNKYGYEEARQLAIEYRQNFDKKYGLNVQQYCN